MTIPEILNYISIWSVAVPFIVGMIWHRKLSRDSLFVLAIVFFSTISQMMDLPEMVTYKNYQGIAYNIYTPCEFILLSFLFRNKIITKNKRTIFSFLCIIYTVIVAFSFYDLGIETFISELASLNNFIYTVWIMLFLLEQYELDKPFLFNFKTPFFWYTIGILFYSVCTLLIFILWYNLDNGDNINKAIKKIIHSIFNINMYVMFTIGIIKDIKVVNLKRKILNSN